jgi:hypothetical protein
MCSFIIPAFVFERHSELATSTFSLTGRKAAPERIRLEHEELHHLRRWCGLDG